MNDNIEYFFRKPVLIIININNEINSTTKIVKETNTTFSHVAKTIRKLEDMGLIKTKRLTREKEITLTEKGKKVKNILLRLKGVMENGN